MVFKFVKIVPKQIIGVYNILKHHQIDNLTHILKLLVQCIHQNEGNNQ